MPDSQSWSHGNQWDEDANDNAWTELEPLQQVGRHRGPSPAVMAVTACVILAVLATVSYGYFGLNWFRPNRSTDIVQAPAATATQAHQPTATTGLAPSPTASPATPTPTPTPARHPPQLSVQQSVFTRQDCNQVNGMQWSCTERLDNTGSSPLPWTASSTMSGASFTPPGGTLTPRGQIQVTFILPCVHSGTIYFTGPANQVAVRWFCNDNDG